MSMRRRAGRWALALHVTVLLGIGYPASAVARDPCAATPNCEAQPQAPIHYSAWDTKGWAYYCTGDHPFFWSGEWGFTGFSWDNSCFSVTEQLNSGGSKFDGLITNWCLKSEDITVTLGCSDIPQNISCKTDGVRLGDPSCPTVGAS